MFWLEKQQIKAFGASRLKQCWSAFIHLTSCAVLTDNLWNLECLKRFLSCKSCFYCLPFAFTASLQLPFLSLHCFNTEHLPLYSVSTSAITKKLSLFPAQSLSLTHTHAQLLLIHVVTTDICSTLWWCIFPTSAISHCSTSSHSVPTTCSAVLLHCIVPRYTDRDRLRQING